METETGFRRGDMEQLTEAIYDAAVDPSGWTHVMRSLKTMFRTGAETLYFLDYRRQAKEVVHIEGIDPSFLRFFQEIFYTPDNPCLHAPKLHKAGAVRTDTILCEHLDDREVLSRSRYYNEWMRPQSLEHTMGTTPLALEGQVLNFSLLRSAKTGPFNAAELRRFTLASSHLRRAVKMAARLDTLGTHRGLTAEALDRLTHGVLLLSERGRVLHANGAAEELLRRGEGIGMHAGQLTVADRKARAAFDALFAALGHMPQAGQEAAGPVVVPLADGERRVVISGARLPGLRSLLGSRPTILLLLVDPEARLAGRDDLLRRLYRLNRSELRLIRALLDGHSLRRAAEDAAITYETARWYLKGLFQKTGTNRQGELIARVLSDLNAASLCMSTNVPQSWDRSLQEVGIG